MTAANLITGIGSLPHHNIDAALEHSFHMSLPFLPQIPIRNPWEFMIAQALEGLPGIEVDKDSVVTLDPDVWAGRASAFNEKLLNAFGRSAQKDAFEAFEPSSATSSSWQPFLWELEERDAKLGKIQLAGPITCQWSLRMKDGSSVESHRELPTQVFRLTLARALAMCRRMQASEIQPVLYLDEPGLLALDLRNPRHVAVFNELRLLVQAIRKEGVTVGLHCCSNTDWKALLGLDLNYLSLDTGHSLEKLLAHQDELSAFVARGGKLSLGIIPTSPKEKPGDPRERFSSLVDALTKGLKSDYTLISRILAEAIYTPACGMALLTVSRAEETLAALSEVPRIAGEFLSKLHRS